nr:transposase [Streptomyces paludis]
MVFGIHKILGYDFIPRFRDLDDQRFWRATLLGATPTASDEPGAHGAGAAAQAGPRRVPRQARHHPPGMQGRDGGSVRLAGTLLEGDHAVEDMARLSPLKHQNLNGLGRYSFTLRCRPRDRGPCATRTRSSWTTMKTARRHEPDGQRPPGRLPGGQVRWSVSVSVRCRAFASRRTPTD